MPGELRAASTFRVGANELWQLPVVAAGPGAFRLQGARHGAQLFLAPRPDGVPTAVVLESYQGKPAEVAMDVSAMRRVELRVRDQEGGPAPAVLLIGRADEELPFAWRAVLATDVRGHAEVHLPAGSFVVYATTGQEHAVALVGSAAPPIELRLQPLPTARFRIVDAADRPIAGVRMQALGAPVAIRPEDPERQWDRVAWQMWRAYAQLPRSDRNGLLVVLLWLANRRMQAAFTHGKRSSGLLTLALGDGEERIVLQ